MASDPLELEPNDGAVVVLEEVVGRSTLRRDLEIGIASSSYGETCNVPSLATIQKCLSKVNT
jgi:hypothetical protein